MRLLWLDCSSLLSFEVVPGDGGRAGGLDGETFSNCITCNHFCIHTVLKKSQSDVTEEVFIFMCG